MGWRMLLRELALRGLVYLHCADLRNVLGAGRKFGGANDRTDFAHKTPLAIAQLINHYGHAEEDRAAPFDQTLCRQSLAAHLGPVIDQKNAIAGPEGALLNLEPINDSSVVRGCRFTVLRAWEQRPGVADGHEANPQPEGHGRSQDEATSLNATDFRNPCSEPRLGKGGHHCRKGRSVVKHSPDIGVTTLPGKAAQQRITSECLGAFH